MPTFPTSYPTGAHVDLFLGAVDPSVPPSFDPRDAMDVTEVVVQEDGGLLPLYEWTESAFKEMARGARLVSGSLLFNRSDVDRDEIWGRTIWAVLSHSRTLHGGQSEGVRDVLRFEFAYEHPQTEAPDPHLHEEVPFTARRLVLVERERAVFDEGQIAQIISDPGAVRRLSPRRERHVFGRVRAVVDSDTLVVELAPDGELVNVRLSGPDAPETPKPDKPGARDNFLAEWRGPHNRSLSEEEMEAHAYAWAVHATNEVRNVLTTAADTLVWDPDGTGGGPDGADSPIGSVTGSVSSHYPGEVPEGWVEGETVRLVDDPGVAPEDQFGRRIFQVHHAGFGSGNGDQGQLGRWLIENGWAKAYPTTTVRVNGDGTLTPQYDELRRLEAEARDRGLGVWGADPPPPQT